MLTVQKGVQKHIINPSDPIDNLETIILFNMAKIGVGRKF